jgi:hypothetical protein
MKFMFHYQNTRINHRSKIEITQKSFTIYKIFGDDGLQHFILGLLACFHKIKWNVCTSFGSVMAKALCYKQEGRGFETQ